MNAPVSAGYSAPDARTESVTLPARPEPLRLKPSETAVIVVDMQNAYASEGGYIDIAGFDVSGAPAAIAKTKTALEAARAAGLTVIFFQNGWDKDYVEAGTPGSPNFHKSNALKTMRARPELTGTLLAKGTWDYAIVDALTAAPGRHRHPEDPLQRLLQHQYRQRVARAGIRNLVFTGIATNVCVESSLRDAFHLEYFAVVLEDATHHAGPPFVRQAALYNIEKFFGWVSTVADFCGAIGQAAPTSSP